MNGGKDFLLLVKQRPNTGNLRAEEVCLSYFDRLHYTRNSRNFII